MFATFNGCGGLRHNNSLCKSSIIRTQICSNPYKKWVMQESELNNSVGIWMFSFVVVVVFLFYWNALLHSEWDCIYFLWFRFLHRFCCCNLLFSFNLSKQKCRQHHVGNICYKLWIKALVFLSVLAVLKICTSNKDAGALPDLFLVVDQDG